MNLARYLVQGVDVWLNTPLRPHEASGTSGMKAAANGALNLSILDGWWAEAFTPEIGWSIGSGEAYDDYNLQDHVESNAIYDILEKQVVPLFYERGSDRLPRQWIAKMKASMKAVCPIFNTHRMLQEYTEGYYIPACKRFKHLSENDMAALYELVDWKSRILEQWSQVRINQVKADVATETSVDVPSGVWVDVHLGALLPQDVTVELYFGQVNANGEIVNPHIIEMQSQNDGAQGDYTFVGHIASHTSGKHGFTVRVMPHHPDLVTPFETGLILWGESS